MWGVGREYFPSWTNGSKVWDVKGRDQPSPPAVFTFPTKSGTHSRETGWWAGKVLQPQISADLKLAACSRVKSANH